MEYLTVIGKATMFFAVALIGIRLMGNQAVGRLTAFDLVVVIAIGALIGAPLADPDLNPWTALTGIVTLVIVQIVTSLLTLKSKRFAKLAIGEPIQIVDKGKFLRSGLQKARLTKENVLEELRLHGVTQVSEVEAAFLEPEGEVSVIRKGRKGDG